MITFIIPTRRENIKETLDSLVNQTNQDFNSIFIDDGYFTSENKYKYFKTLPWPQYENCAEHKTNSYGNFQRQVGILKCYTNYIAFLDDDDILNSEYVNIINKITDEAQPDMIRFSMAMGCYYDYDSEIMNHARADFSSGKTSALNYDYIRHLDSDNDSPGNIGTGSFVVKTEIAKRYGWSQEHSQYSDYYSIEKFIKASKNIIRIPDVLYLAQRLKGEKHGQNA